MKGTYPLTVTLTKEINRVTGRSYVYAYDNAGNITSKKQYAFTTGTLGTVQTTYNYAYNSTSGWGDLLTSFAGESITYDEIGNPTSIGSYIDLVWEGRKLVGYANGDTGVEVTYTYNDEGIRTSKDVGGVLHTYTLDGSTIVAEEFGNYLFVYLYDETGSPVGIQYRQKSDAAEVFSTYVFEKNLQGDIIAIYNESGTKIASYTYDAWGNFTLTYASGISATDRVAATNNPFTYRGYYFDSETDFYSLNSRYYNSAWGRFINPDAINVINASPNALTDKNLYVYCDNNPIMRTDSNGDFWNVIAGGVIGGLVSFVSSVASELLDDEEGVDWTGVFISTGIGAAEGALIALCPGAAVAISAGSSMIDTAISGIRSGKDLKTVAVDSVVSGVFGAATGSWGSDFTKGGAVNDAVKSIGKLMKKGVSSTAKKTAKKTIAKTMKYIGKSYVSGQIDDFAVGGVEWYSQKIINRYFWG